MEFVLGLVAARKKRSFYGIISLLLYLFLCLNCFTKSRCFAQLLPEEEVRVLQTISSKLQNTHWNVRRSSCTVPDDFNVNITSEFFSNVTCDCSFIGKTVCHVTNIQLKGLNLTGTLPAEFGNLSHLQEIDLSRNYLNGSIPRTLNQLPLITLSLLGNRIGGMIPEELGDISTLEDLNLEDNQLGGPLPEKLGSLSNLRRFLARPKSDILGSRFLSSSTFVALISLWTIFNFDSW